MAFQQTPKKEQNVLQVPSSSPINVRSSPVAAGHAMPSHHDAEEEKRKEEMKKRFYAHKFWPVLQKRFYYLTEPEIFKGMVKGKGNLRDICLWLGDNIPLSERMNQYDNERTVRRLEEENAKKQAAAAEQENRRQEEARALELAEVLLPPSPLIQSPAPQVYEDEDASPVKVAGKARQKRSLLSMEAVKAPDTKIQLMKPKVSILEKYRNRTNTQTRIDSLFLRANGEMKKRKLVRADDMDESTPATSQSTTPNAIGLPGVLTQAFGFKEEAIPRLTTSKNLSVEIDELDLLEEKIRANRKKKKSSSSRTSHSDDELEEDVFSDDMSAEDDDDHYSNGLTSIDGQILEFLNSSSVDDIVEICNVQPKIADLLISKRPFKTIYEVSEDRFDDATPEPETKRRGGQRKAMGMRIVESTEFSLKGYKAVDSLVKKCSEYGNLISSQMDRWGVKITGEGELSMVEVDANEEDNEDDDIVSNKRSLPYVKHKPTLLAPDIELKNYQQVGINWLNLLYHNKLSCILADEMGLGKTCQVISFMAHLKVTSDKKRPHLVVVPSSTLENWLREFNKFCPDLIVQAYYGSQAEREDLRYELQEMQYDVLVTTYNLATGAPPDFKFLRSQHFDMIVYDEGHMLKNSSSERYNKLMRLKADFRLLLTGTPLQNNLKELVSLLAFMLPNLFVEKREDLQGLFNKKASVDGADNYNPLLSQQAINKAKTMMTPFVLRRKKAQVLKYLPGKSHEIVKCKMTAKQREIYSDYISQGKATKLERERRKNLEGKEAEEARKIPIASSSNVMMSLRKASMHPLLFRTIYTDDILKEMAKKIMKEPEYVSANRHYIYEDMQVMSDYELNALCEKFPKTIGSYVLDKEKWLDSGKITKLLEVLDNVIERKEKVLVFSLFTQMLDILEKVLSFSNITFLRLDGQTSVDTRQDIIDRFYEDETIPVFLLSTKAGGFGINLVAANNVVIFDQSFNPHDDKQAEDRAHRVGQTNEVMVTKLISEDTIDENILMLAENKLQLDQSISNDTNETKFEEKAASMFEKLLFN
ncbi:CIC11C00000005414 [Sungouiella intermedia]|uniref:DNA helicase n=1 Tax=Sungouiella intermedia TaxID=45354 RepID=A0A1L0D6C7_9ASCO|nr:CIC11C00000005414 [[Candida] intermedia]